MFAVVGKKAFFVGAEFLCKMSIGALLVGLLLCGEAAAQGYKTDDTTITDRKAKAAYSQVISPLLRDLHAFNQNKAKVDAYFKKYSFPRMTSTKQADLGGLAKRREDLFKQIRRTDIEEVQKHLTSLTASAVIKHALGNYHPAVRYNAVLILGMLDQQYSGSNTQPPVPLPAGTKALLVFLEKKEVRGVKIPASLKLGALKGLERHVRFGIDAQYDEPLTKALLELIAQQQPPEEVTQEVHHWIQCQAVRVLVRQFAKGPSVEVQNALTKMMGDQEMGLDDRCCVAELLGKMDYRGAQEIDATAAKLALGALTQAVFQEEVSIAKDFQKELVGGRNFGNNRFGGGGGRLGRSGDVGPRYERRRIMARLKGIQEGGKALSAALPDEELQQLKKLLAPIDTFMTMAGKKDSDDIFVAGNVLELVREIDRLVAGWDVAEEPAETEEDFS